jgi:hypothetical protein
VVSALDKRLDRHELDQVTGLAVGVLRSVINLVVGWASSECTPGNGAHIRFVRYVITPEKFATLRAEHAKCGEIVKALFRRVPGAEPGLYD